MVEIKSWIVDNYDEVLGTVVALFYLYFSIKQKIWLWPLGLISSAIYAYVFFRSKIYAAMGLQLYYVAISVYGWYLWQKQNSDSDNEKLVSTLKSNFKTIFLLSGISLVLFAGISQILVYFTDSKIPYYDSFITSLSIVATWMLAQKIVEHWWVWVVADLVSVMVYYDNKLYFATFLYFVYTVMAFIGYNAWKKGLAVQ